MKKELTIAAITFLFAPTPVFAHSIINQGNNHNTFANNHFDNDGDQDDINPISIPSSAPCDPSLNWKNHGAYVSCVAHWRHKNVENAAVSDIGKHNPTCTPTPTISPTISPTITESPTPSETITPTPTVSITPTETISPTPTASPTPSVSPTPSTSVSPSPTASDTQIPQPTFTNIQNAINRLISFLSHLL